MTSPRHLAAPPRNRTTLAAQGPASRLPAAARPFVGSNLRRVLAPLTSNGGAARAPEHRLGQLMVSRPIVA